MSIKVTGVRPFASMSEFEPSRERWFVARGAGCKWRVTSYGPGFVQLNGGGPLSYKELFDRYTFEDSGTPAGYVETEVR